VSRPARATEVRWHDAGSLDELWEGELIGLELAGEPVLLVHLLGGEVVAYQGICPHQEQALADGDWDTDTAVLTCSGHHWEFDLRTGAGINPADCRLYGYPVNVDGSAIRVGIPQDGERHYNRCAGS
jgi:toluene monooxygenase system ferredoxin subunit